MKWNPAGIDPPAGIDTGTIPALTTQETAVTQTPYDRMSTPTWGTGAPASTERLDPTTRKFAGRQREVTVRIDYCSGSLDGDIGSFAPVLDVLRQLHPEFTEQPADHDPLNAHYDWSRSFVVKGTGAVVATIRSGLRSDRTDLRVHVTAKGDRGGVLFKAMRIAGVGWLPSRIDVALDVVGDLEYFTKKRTAFDKCLPTGKEAIRIGTRKGVQDPGLTWMSGKSSQPTVVRWYRKGPESGDPHLFDVNRLEFQFRPHDEIVKRALSRCNDPLEIIAMAGPKWVRDLAAELIGKSPRTTRVVASPVIPSSPDTWWATFLKQYSMMLYRIACFINPSDPQSGWNAMWRDIVATAAYSAARKSGRNPVGDDHWETAVSAKTTAWSTAPASVQPGRAQGSPERPSHQMVAGPEPVVLELSSVVTNPGDSQPMNGSGAVSNRGGKWLFMDGWVNPAKADPGRVLNMMGLLQPDRTGDGVDRGNRRARRARAAG